MTRNSIRFQYYLAVVLSFALPLLAHAESEQATSITLLHTNDLHSHLRPEKTPLGLGGVARIASLIEEVEKSNPNTLVADGGDWSEGTIYYNLHAGAETLRLMSQVGYDVAVVGNHDFLNGPDVLLDAISRAQPSMGLVASNFQATLYPRAEELKAKLPPYVIREVGGIKIAFIGVLTYDFIYDHFLAPVRIVSPFKIIRELTASLRSQADVIVAVSHNAVRLNLELLEVAPDLDWVIGAHDHRKITKPMEVTRGRKRPGYLVEAGAWGRYVGRLDMQVLPRAVAEASGKSPIQSFNYKLLQVDERYPDHPVIQKEIEKLEAQLETHYGPIFHDHVAESEIELNRLTGLEIRMGNLVTDAYHHEFKTDLAIDQIHLIYGELHPGPIHTADLYNAYPAVYNPKTDKSWTVKTFHLQGKTLSWLLNLLGSSLNFAPRGVPSVAGMSITYEPKKPTEPQSFIMPNLGPSDLPSFLPEGPVYPGFFDKPSAEIPIAGNSALISMLQQPFFNQDVTIGGEPLKPEKTYRVAAGEGIVQAIQILNSIFPAALPIFELADTGREMWRVLADYVRLLSPITDTKVPVGNRIRTRGPDLGVIIDDVRFSVQSRPEKPEVLAGRLQVLVRNFGAADSPEQKAWIHILGNRHGTDTTADPEWQELAPAQSIPKLGPQQKTVIEWQLNLDVGIQAARKKLVPLTVRVQGDELDMNPHNDEVMRWVPVPPAPNKPRP